MLHFETENKSRFTHGIIYHMLYDRPLSEARRVVIKLISEGSFVLDIASGTGELCFGLAAKKQCRVVGIDLSRRMIEFAKKRNRYDNVRFVHGDASSLTDFEPSTFDYATILFTMHELPRQKQIAVLKEALRVALSVIVVDSQVPLPRNLHGIALRLVEASGGPDHYRPFARYLAAGGISGILADSGVKASIAQRSIFWHGCREIVVLER
jgi:SAM-dependent methyltransferase